MTEATVHVIAHLVPLPGKAEQLARAVRAILPEVRREPGCLAYFAHDSVEEPGTIVMIEAWAKQADLDAHAKAPAFVGLAAQFAALLAEPPVIERLRRTG